MVEILTPVLQRIAALEKHAKNVRFRGVYQKAEHYEKGNLVTHKGSMWSALTDGPGIPGEDHDGWQLAVKSGEAPR